ncbi:MAG: DNA repair protein RecO [Lachnospiraceae bacterium]|nr:DNA repair protein RecO [Lachnospiraceae bacterium]
MPDDSHFIKANGFVISSMPIGETDRRIEILTKELGKTSAFVRGGAKPKSPLLAATNPFFFGEFELYAGTNSYTLRSARQKARFDEILGDLDDTYMGMYFLEVAQFFGKEGLDESERLNLLYAALKAIIRHEPKRETVRIIYELRTMMINGVYPDVFSCYGCGQHLDVNETNYFGVGDCFFYDSDCRSQIRGTAMELTPTLLYTLQLIFSLPTGKLFSFDVNGQVLADLEYVAKRMRAVFFEHTFHSEEFLK